ncbi:zinc ribbon domain-containing protein [Nonomuraea angiospora]|uniref:RNA-guided endonuclease InsQ/TnpB family protein n=1 Tax=Nonomuraea angiospora TaxID=46172 RepID=UPI0034089010
MLTGRKYRLDLAPGQAEFAERIGGVCRSVWNTALEQRRTYRRRDAWIGYHEQARQLAEAKGEFAWLAEVPGHCLQQTLIDLDQACSRHGTWKVRWKSRARTRPSFRCGVAAPDFAAKTAHALAAGFELIVFEALATKNMTAGVAPKPDPEQSGAFLPNGAASKSGLNRSILDKGWHRIELATRGKARYTGTCVITVNPAYTSQTCNVCTVVDRKSRQSQAVFRCASCGHTEHADVNAAKNILTAGRAEHAQPRPGARAGARKPRDRVGRKANRQATAAQGHATASPELAGIPRP